MAVIGGRLLGHVERRAQHDLGAAAGLVEQARARVAIVRDRGESGLAWPMWKGLTMLEAGTPMPWNNSSRMACASTARLAARRAAMSRNDPRRASR